MSDLGPRFFLLLAAACTAAGIADAAVSRQWDLLAIFVATASLLMAMWLRQRAHRISVTLRPDLAHWIEHRAESAGEPFDDVLDRAVAAFKHGVVADERSG